MSSDAAPERPEKRVLRIDGLCVGFDVWGTDGPAVLLLHGIPGDRATWRRTAPVLAPGHRVVAPDLAGFGGSDAPPAGWHARDHARSMWLLMDALGIDGVHVAGFDFGGPTAVHMGATHARRVRSLTLAATNVFPDTPIPFPLRVASVPGLGRLASRLVCGRPGLAAMWFAATADKRAFPLREFRKCLASSRTVRSTRLIFQASLSNLPALYADVERALRATSAPVGVVWGDRDPFFPVGVGERTAGAAPRGEMVLLHGCGHFVPQERPEELARHILRTIARGQAI